MRWIIYLGLFVLYCWPRYFFMSVGGKGVSGFTLYAFIFLSLSLYLILVRRATLQSVKASFANSGIVLALFMLFWAWRILSDFQGLTPGDSLALTFLHMLYFGSWFISAAILFQDFRVRNALPYIILINGVVATLCGLIELRTGSPISTVLGFADFQAGDAYTLQNVSDTLERGEVARVRSLFSHPIVYGQVMASMVPVAMHFVLRSRGALKVLGVILGFCIVTSISICNARSPIFVAVASGGMYFALFYLDPRRLGRMYILLWAVIGFAVVAPVVSGALTTIAVGRTSEEAISSTARDRQMEQGLNGLALRPIIGYGDGNAGEIAGILGRKNTLTVDNYYLTRAVDNGYVGVAIFILMIFSFVLKGVRLAVLEFDSMQRSLLCMATATIVALAIGLWVISIEDTLAMLFLMAGFLVAANSFRMTRARRRTPVAGLNFAAPIDFQKIN